MRGSARLRRNVLTLGLALLLGPGWAGAAEEPMQRVFPYPTHVATLDNGLKVILVPIRSAGLVAVWTLVRTGSRDEYEPGRTGFAHFFEHMMFRGTEQYPAEAYNDVMTRMGADANAYTTDDLTAYHLNIAPEDLETVLELESDRFRNLAYSPQVFQTEAGAVYGEYRKSRTDPFFVITEALRREAFTVHTYGHTTMGYEADIREMPKLYDYSRTFFKRYYRPDNVVLLIAGEIEIEPTLERIRRYYAEWSPGYVAPAIPPEPEQTSEKRIEVAYDGQSLPILWVAYRAGRFDPRDRQHVALGLVAELAFGETSEIHKALVLDRQLVEFIQADLDMNRDPGMLDVYARVKDPARLDEVLAEIDRTVAGCRERPPDEERLAALKSRLKYAFLMRLDTPDRVASSLARIVAITGGVEAVDQLYATYEAITPADLQAAAERYLRPERRTIARLHGAR